MRGLFLLARRRFRHNDLGRLFPYKGVYEEAYSQENERNAEKLAHIEHHIVLECDLGFLDEFNQEP